MFFIVGINMPLKITVNIKQKINPSDQTVNSFCDISSVCLHRKYCIIDCNIYGPTALQAVKP